MREIVYDADGQLISDHDDGLPEVTPRDPADDGARLDALLDGLANATTVAQIRAAATAAKAARGKRTP